MKYFWGKPIGGFRGIVMNLRTVFSFRESEIGPPFIWGLYVLDLWRKYFRPQRVLGLETVVVEKTCLPV